jgi:adenylyltransferase/sulfurtransferase
MPKIPVELPSLLHPSAGGQSEVTVEADTVKAALDRLKEEYPLLKTHLFEVDGTRRKHVMIFYNEQNIDWLDDLNHRMTDGDRLIVVQAVAGG